LVIPKHQGGFSFDLGEGGVYNVNMNDTITFSVSGTPRPLPRPRFIKGRKRPVSITSATAKVWKQAVERAARQCLADLGKDDLGDEALRVDIEFTFATPKAERWGKPHTNKPDKDNLEKMILDCMERAGMFGKGDEQVAKGNTAKRWGQQASVVVLIRGIGAEGGRRPSQGAEIPAWLGC